MPKPGLQADHALALVNRKHRGQRNVVSGHLGMERPEHKRLWFLQPKTSKGEGKKNRQLEDQETENVALVWVLLGRNRLK